MTFDIPSIFSLELSQGSYGLLPVPTALAVVILIAYLSGRRVWNRKRAKLDAKHKYEIERTAEIAAELEDTASALRHELNFQLNHFGRFKRRLNEACESGDLDSWKEMIANADQLLEPTMRFAKSLSSAYGSIREHAYILESFAQDLPDRQAALSNGRGFWGSVDELVALARRGSHGFSIAVFSLDQHSISVGDCQQGDVMPSLSDLTLLIESFKLDSFFVANDGSEDLTLVMPHTSLVEACEVGELVRKIVFERLSATVSCGIVEYKSSDNSMSLLMKARSALYSAKAAGSNRQCVYTGEEFNESSVDESGIVPGESHSNEAGRAITATPRTNSMVAPAVIIDPVVTDTAAYGDNQVAETLDFFGSSREAFTVHDCQLSSGEASFQCELVGLHCS